jgi:hypothetical protein
MAASAASRLELGDLCRLLSYDHGGTASPRVRQPGTQYTTKAGNCMCQVLSIFSKVDARMSEFLFLRARWAECQRCVEGMLWAPSRPISCRRLRCRTEAFSSSPERIRSETVGIRTRSAAGPQVFTPHQVRLTSGLLERGRLQRHGAGLTHSARYKHNCPSCKTLAARFEPAAV